MKHRLTTSLFFVLLAFGINTSAQNKIEIRKTPYSIFIQLSEKYKSEKPSKINWQKPGSQILNITTDANKGQLVVFKLGIWAKHSDLKSVKIISEDLISKGKMGIISGSFLRYADSEEALLHTADFKSHPFNLKKDEQKIIYAVYDIPKYISIATFSGKLKIEADGLATKTVHVNLRVAPDWLKKS